MRSPSFTRLLLSFAGFAAVACSDRSPTAPLATRSFGAGGPRPDVIVDAMAPDHSWADFTVTPSGGRFSLGPHSISFPDHAICDPATSSYGPTEWKAPCQPLDRPLQIHAVLNTANGHSWIDFTPQLRFVPSTDPSRFVILTMSLEDMEHENASGDRLVPAGPTPPILFAPYLGAPGINDAASDPTLATHVSADGESVFRRVEHFTGYVISTGYTGATPLY